MRFPYARRLAVATLAATAVLTAGTATAAHAATVTWRNANSNKCLEVYHSSTANGAVVDQYTCNGTATQNWTINVVGTVGDGIKVVELRNANSKKCLEVYHSSTANGATVDQWTCNGTATQRWYLEPDGSRFRFENSNSGQFLDVSGSSTANGAAVIQRQSIYGLASQYWL